MELQDSTRYEKTATLLERFDPDYVPPTPRKQQQQHALRTAFIPPTPRAPGVPTPVHSMAAKTSTFCAQLPHDDACTVPLRTRYVGAREGHGVALSGCQVHLQMHDLVGGLLLQQGRGGKRLGLGPLQHMTDAGLGLMPAFDKLATSLIGDNPALTEALRCRCRATRIVTSMTNSRVRACP